MTEINKVINYESILFAQKGRRTLNEEYVAIANQRIQDAIQAKEGGVH